MDYWSVAIAGGSVLDGGCGRGVEPGGGGI